MDHLPYADGANCSFRVPDLGPIYPDAETEVPMSVQEITQVVSKNRPDLSTDLCIQELLYFRPLRQFHELLAVPFKRSNFVREDDKSPPYISCESLISFTVPYYVSQIARPRVRAYMRDSPSLFDKLSTFGIVCFDAHMSHTTHDLTPRWVEFFGHFHTAFEKISQAYFQNAQIYGWQEPEGLRTRMLLASALLYVQLKSVARSLLIDTSHETFGQLNTYGLPDIAADSAARRGWCATRIHSFASMNIPNIMFVAFCMRPWSGLSHRRCEFIGDRCQLVNRYSSQVEKPLHVNHELCRGDCGDIGFRGSDLAEIIEADDVPLLTFRDDEDTIRIGLGSRRQNEAYIAVSHVWAHGLGNATENLIPFCQVRKLERLAHGLGMRNKSIWLDVLCIPVEPDYATSRRKIIDRMRGIYQDAQVVIVIDERLEGINTTDPLMLQAEICLSDWMHRMWTLQEMLLPGPEKVYISFKDGLRCVNDLLKIFMADPLGCVETRLETIFGVIFRQRFQLYDIPSPHKILRDRSSISELDKAALIRLAPSMPEDYLFSDDLPDRKRSQSSSARLQNLIESFSSRSATKVADEPLCLATLLGLDMSTLPLRPSMIDIYRALGEIPLSIIFLTGPRCSEQGFSWAQASFLDRVNPMLSNLVDDAAVATLRKRSGLEYIAYTGIALIPQHPVMVKTGQDGKYAILQIRSLDSLFWIIYTEPDVLDEDGPLEEAEVVLLMRHIDFLTSPNGADTGSAVMARILMGGSGALMLRIIANVVVERLEYYNTYTRPPVESLDMWTVQATRLNIGIM